MLKNIYIFYSHRFFSQFFSLSSFSSLFLHLCSLLSTDPNTISSLSSFSGYGFWLCPELKRGCGSWLGPLWVVGCGLWVSVVVGQWWLWIGVVVGCGLWIGVVVGCGLWIGVVGSWSWIGELGWSGSLVVDRWLKGVVGCGSAAEVGRWSWLGYGWGGSGDDFFWMGLLRWVSNRGWVVVVVCSDRVWVSNRLRWWFFLIGVGLCLFVFVSVFMVCGLC